jgi:transketolase
LNGEKHVANAPTVDSAALDTLSINTMRFLAVDAVQKANSGHPGLPLGASPMAYALWTRYLRHNPRNPKWHNRDRFILSAGHGSMLLYALLHLTGYDLSLEDVKNFRQYDSKTPGHPEYGFAPGVETTTGPLGQGLANAVGFAWAEAFLAETFNRPDFHVVDHYTYVIASDGDMMEGVTSEACSLAGHLKLGKLIVLYDDNKVMLSNDTEVAFTEDVKARFTAYGWQVLSVADGNNVEAVAQAIADAKRDTERPTLIDVRTIIGYGSPNKQGTSKAHGEALGVEEVKLTKQALGWPDDQQFYVPGQALENFRTAIDNGAKWEAEWNELFAGYKAKHPELAAQYEAAFSNELPDGWDADLESILQPAGSKATATRDANNVALNAIAKHIPTMIGGDADLAGSTKTLISGQPLFSPTNHAARNLQFGVREHAMGAITNGLILHGGIIKPYTATFMPFSDYMRPPIRLACLMAIAPIFIFTHDSIGVGEDGPTHQPVEQLAALRAIPHITVLRPADANETIGAWKAAMEQTGPTVLVFTRQKLPIYAPEGVIEGVSRGAYIRAEAEGGTPDVLLLATGSEVSLAMTARDELAKQGIKARVVSMPSWELFRRQDKSYRDQVLPPSITARVGVEAASFFGWSEWVGDHGTTVTLDRFGASGPYEAVYEHLGITSGAVVNAAKSLLGK